LGLSYLVNVSAAREVDPCSRHFTLHHLSIIPQSAGHFVIASLDSVDPRPAPNDTSLDPDQNPVSREGVKVKLSRAAYESPGADPGETLRRGEDDR